MFATKVEMNSAKIKSTSSTTKGITPAWSARVGCASRMTILIVGSALLIIGEYLIGLTNFFELRFVTALAIGMVL